MRIDYRQDDTFYCVPDDSFSARDWKTLFEYDESVRSISLMRIALLNPEKTRLQSFIYHGSLSY